MAVVMDAEAARQAILSGTAPDGLIVTGNLALYDQPDLTRLPDGLQVNGQLYLRNCPQLRALPNGLHCNELEIEDIPITTLPADLCVTSNLSLGTWRGVANLETLPAGLSVQTLIVHNCPQLQALPADLQVTRKLDLGSCPQLEALPAGLTISTLTINHCPRLKA